MAWAVSVRTRRRFVSSATRRISKTDIDVSAKPFQFALPSALHALSLAVQFGVLATALAHITTAPILAALAVIGAIVSFATSGSPRWLGSVTPDFRPGTTEHGDAPARAVTRGSAATASGDLPTVSPAAALPGLRKSPASSFNDFAPANDAVAWAGLCARLSHELRTPLNAVLGFSELMTVELHGPLGLPRYREYVSHIRESGQALLKSTEDTLAITAVLSNTRHQGSTFRGLAVEPLLADAWHFIEPMAQARFLTLELDVPSGLEVLADQRTLRQAMINLLEEAICHAADDGTISVRATSERGMVELEIRSGSCKSAHADNTLPITLASALLEFSGCKLEMGTDGGNWQARTLLDRAAQPDFFEELDEARAVSA